MIQAKSGSLQISRVAEYPTGVEKAHQKRKRLWSKPKPFSFELY
jgi:hypothetical protein